MKKKKELKKIVPNVFKYSHFDPPIIYDSKWKQKKFDKEKNRFYFSQKNEMENKSIEKNDEEINNSNILENINKNKKNEIDDNNRKRIIYNLRFKKILEEASTSKTLSNSNSKSNSKNKNKNKINNNDVGLKRFNSEIFSKKIGKSQTIIAGKYHLSLSKLEKQFNNIENMNKQNLNIVKNSDYEILKEKIMLYKSPSMKESNSSSTLILPPIRNNKKNYYINFNKKKQLNPIQTKDNNIIDLTIDMNNESVKNKDIKKRSNAAISQFVKNFYTKQKNIGYTSFINRYNNRYYKILSKSTNK